MTATLKQFMGEAGAGLDKSHGTDRLYDVLLGLVNSHTQLVAQFNQLRADYNAHEHNSVAIDAATTATDLTTYVDAE